MRLTRKLKISLFALILFSILLTSTAVYIYQLLYSSATVMDEDVEFKHIFIHTGWGFDETMRMLEDEGILKHPGFFRKLAELKKYPESVRSGRYRINSGMSNMEIVNHLRTGKQDPVNVIFNFIRIPEQLAARIARQIEPDSLSLITAMLDTANLQRFGIPEHQIAMMYIPNTYEFFWNTSAQGFVERMHREYEAFWNESRQARLSEIGLSRAEVVTLASIIEMETRMNDEKARIAGVYMNRLRIGMRLQADPTLVFAHRDFTIRRVLNRHKRIDSPYNTYRYAGLPPGPISFPSISSIDAVLNYENHNYFYFAAKEDFSGYHNFSRTYQQHLANARRYHRALNERGIRR
jgi:UPF0755 protein